MRLVLLEMSGRNTAALLRIRQTCVSTLVLMFVFCTRKREHKEAVMCVKVHAVPSRTHLTPSNAPQSISRSHSCSNNDIDFGRTITAPLPITLVSSRAGQWCGATQKT